MMHIFIFSGLYSSVYLFNICLICISRVNDPVAMKLLGKAGEMPSLEPPEDESIKTLYVGGVNDKITEQDLRDNFYAHGEIESVKIVLQRACAFVTYTTREAAEKAAEELSNKLVIKGVRLKLMWGRPQTQKPESEGSDVARQPVAISGMLPRAVISQQQNQSLDHNQQMQYFNFPPPTQPERSYYPSMDPQRMGAVVSSQEGSSTGPAGSSEKNDNSEHQQRQHHAYQGTAPHHGQYYQQYYPPYGYMPSMPPYQQYPPPYPPVHSTVPPHQHAPTHQQYQYPTPQAGSAPSSSASHNPAPAKSGPPVSASPSPAPTGPVPSDSTKQ